MAVQIPYRKGHFKADDVSGFSHMLLSTIPSGPDVGISRHAVNHCSNWPAVEAVDCHIKVSEWKILLQCGLSSKFFDHLLLFWIINVVAYMSSGYGWYGDGAGTGSTVEENSGIFSLIQMCW